MKKLLFLLILSLVFAGCKKDSIPTVSVQVMDAITNTPVKGATVGLHRCSPGEPLCGLIAYRTNTTGEDGSCRFNKDDFDQTKQVQASKSDYWGIMVLKNTLLSIYPEGWMNLRIIRGTNYPAQSQLKIIINNTLTGLTSFKEYNTAADSSIQVRGFGGMSNKIDWQVLDPSSNILNSGTWNQQIPRLSTVNATLNY
jgi:hypothetical protein